MSTSTVRCAAVVALLWVSTAQADTVPAYLGPQPPAAEESRLAPLAPATPSQDGLVDNVRRWQSQARTVANKQVDKGAACRELVHAGRLPLTATAQFNCIMRGPESALAAAGAASNPVRP